MGYLSVNIPDRYRNMTLDSWVPSADLDPRPDLRRWLASPRAERPWCVAFLGKNGTGKTHLATALFREVLALGAHGWWFDAVDILSQLRDESAPGWRPPQGCTSIEHKVFDPRLLLIDDFACTRITDFAHEQWLRLLSHRYNHLMPTLITANAETLDVFDALDPRITSRLHEGLVVTLTGHDRRAA